MLGQNQQMDLAEEVGETGLIGLWSSLTQQYR